MDIFKTICSPDIFQINRLPPHSDHIYFSSIEEEKVGKNMNFRQSLNGLWRFSYAKSFSHRAADFYKKEFVSDNWDFIKVPAHIQLEGYDSPHYVNTMYPWDGHEKLIPTDSPNNIPTKFNPVGSYIKKFFIPKNWKDSPIFISFQGVESSFSLWVNGEYVGYSEDSFTPSEFNISKYIIDGENSIAVEVYKWCSGSWLEDQDFWRFSGIFRDVYLYTTPPVHVRDLFVKTKLIEGYSKGVITSEITFDFHEKYFKEIFEMKNSGISICKEIYDCCGTLISTSEVLEIDSLKLTLESTIESPSLWSAESPYLYKILYIIKNKNTDEIIEVVSQKIGVREFKIQDKIMKINGKRIVFKGVNRHEFSCFNGRVVSEEEMLWDIKFLKANNFNAVRTSHYPNHSRWYELCDEYGLYVIDEANIETHGTWQKMGVCKPEYPVPDSNPIWHGAVLDRGASMLERDKNHPSIIIWSCGNEAYGGENLYKLSQYFRERDPSRVVHYEGVFWDRRYNDTSDMESRMYAKVSEIEEYLNNNPTKPFILCEYSHAMGNSNGNLYKYTDLEEKYEMYQGGFIWDYIDQSLMKKGENNPDSLLFGGDFSDRPTDYNFCVNGLIYGNRVPSPKVQEVKQLFSDFKLTPNLEGVLIKNNSLFTDLSHYNVHWSTLKEGKIISCGIENLSLSPLSSKEFKLPFTKQEEPGEYIHELSLKLKSDTLWGRCGDEISFGQYVYQVKDDFSNLDDKISFGSTLKVEDCDINIGVIGEGFHHIFSRSYGSIVSMKFKDTEFISAPILPNFWRAPTDNDRGNKMSFRYAQWKIASLYSKAVAVNLSYENLNSVAVIEYVYALPTSVESHCTLKYKIDKTGEIRVELEYPGFDGLSEIPLFGITFKVPNLYSNIKWYGNGPEETYIDRKHGAKIGIFQSTVKDSISKYVIPQECGNKTDIRWFKILDNKGIGLTFSSKDFFEFSALPYTCHELESAYHLTDLPPSNYTVININKLQMGIGGDDSWGAQTHSEFLIPSNNKLNLSFKISFD